MKKADGLVSAVTWNAAHEVNEDVEGVDTCFWQQEWSRYKRHHHFVLYISVAASH